jgi:hypothetical protein
MTAPFTPLPEDLEHRFWLRNHRHHWGAIVASMKMTILDNRYLSAEQCSKINAAIQAANAVLGIETPTPPDSYDHQLWQAWEERGDDE